MDRRWVLRRWDDFSARFDLYQFLRSASRPTLCVVPAGDGHVKPYAALQRRSPDSRWLPTRHDIQI